MRKVMIFALATAAFPAALAAQTVSPPVKWEDTPNVRLNLPGAGVTAAAVQAPATMAPLSAPVAVAPRPMPMAASPRPMTLAPRPAPVAMAPRPMPVAAARPMPQPIAQAMPPMAGPPPRQVQTFRMQHQRMGPGQRVGGVWASPRVRVRNFDAFGLYPPATGDRWIRYYDDALLVDDGGVVRDGRYGLDWDQYGDEWSEEDGVPVYVGRGDYQPDEEDYAYVEQYERGAERAYANNERYQRRFEERYEDGPERGPPIYHGGGYGPPPRTMVYHGEAPPLDPRDYPPGTVITETIVTTPAVRTAQTYYVEQAPRYRTKVIKRLRRHKAECNCDAPAPAPIPYGEKG